MATASEPLIESQLPGVAQAGGINTNKPITMGGSANFDASGSTGTFKTPTGAITLGGAITFSSTQTGMKPTVVSGSGATVTLTASQSGSIILFDRAAGIVYTLPAPAVGLYYDFIITTTITTNNAKVITDAGTTFVQGDIALSTTGGAPTDFQGNGTTHISVLMNGTTTGGILGTHFRLTCVMATQWQATGLAFGSGVLATPFSTV